MTRARGRRLALQLALTTLTVAAVFSFLVSPARTWRAQQAEHAELESELADLGAVNEALTRRAALLETPDEIERIAREDYNLVRPTDESYVVLLPPAEDDADTEGSADQPDS